MLIIDVWLGPEASTLAVNLNSAIKNVFLKISQNSPENICV